MRRPNSSTLFTVFALAVCTPDAGDPFVPKYETERLRIGMSFDAELCRGHLDAWESHLNAIEQTLDVSRDFAWLFLYEYDEEDRIVADCGFDVFGGCWDGSVARATLEFVPHELVHAWTATIQGRALPFLREGIAVRMDGTVQRGRIEPMTVNDLLITDLTEEDYRRAGHFVAWWIAIYGVESFMNLYTRASHGMSESDVSAVFLDVVGESPNHVLQAYNDSAKTYYPGMGGVACGRGPLIPWQADTVILPAEGTCAEGPFFGFESTQSWWQRVTVEVPSSGTYLFDPGDRWASMTRCLTAPADESELPQLKPDGVMGDWLNFTPLSPGEYQEGWVDVPLQLEAGTYEVWVERSHENPDGSAGMSLTKL